MNAHCTAYVLGDRYGVVRQVEVHRVEAARSEGNLLYLLHVYCDTLSRLLEQHGFTGFGK